MKRTISLIVLFVISCSLCAMAQPYYFYDDNGTKVNITLNNDIVLVSIPKDLYNWKEISERICANVQPSFTFKYDPDFLSVPVFRADLEKLSSPDFWKEDMKSVIITPSFLLNGNNSVYFTFPQVLVRLNKAEDEDLLTPYIEKYKLKITSISNSFLYYTLKLSLDSSIGPLECANIIFESGNFKWSVPNYGTTGFDYETTIPNTTSSPSGSHIVMYDLNGLKLTSKPVKGIYIQNGKKRLGGAR